MGLDEQEKPIRQHPKSDETTSEAHLKPVWMGILTAVTMDNQRWTPSTGQHSAASTTVTSKSAAALTFWRTPGESRHVASGF